MRVLWQSPQESDTCCFFGEIAPSTNSLKWVEYRVWGFKVLCTYTADQPAFVFVQIHLLQRRLGYIWLGGEYCGIKRIVRLFIYIFREIACEDDASPFLPFFFKPSWKWLKWLLVQDCCSPAWSPGGINSVSAAAPYVPTHISGQKKHTFQRQISQKSRGVHLLMSFGQKVLTLQNLLSYVLTLFRVYLCGGSRGQL